LNLGALSWLFESNFDRPAGTPHMSRKRRLALDWDQTITESDTLGLLADAASAPKDVWQGIVDEYVRDFTEFSTSSSFNNLQELITYLDKLKEIENAS